MFFDRIGTSSTQDPQPPRPSSTGRLAALGLAATMALSASLSQISRLYAEEAPADGAPASGTAEAGARPAAAADAATAAPQPAAVSLADQVSPPAANVPQLSPKEAYKLGQQQYRKGDWVNARKNLESARDGNYQPGFFEGPAPSEYIDRMDKKEAADRDKAAKQAAAAPAPSTPVTPAPVADAATQAAPAAPAPGISAASPATAPAVAAAPTTQPEAVVPATAPATPAAPVAEAPAAPEEHRLSAKQSYSRAREEFRKGDWIAARADFEAARDSNYRPGLFEDSPGHYLARMDKKEAADRAQTEQKLAMQRQQEAAQQQALLKPVPAEAAPATAPAASPTTEPAVAAAPTPAVAVTSTPTEPTPPAASREERALEELKATSRAQELQRQQDQYESQRKTQEAVAAENDNLDRARQLFSQAVQLDPDNAQARGGLNRVLILQGRSTQNTNALEDLDRRNKAAVQEITFQFDQAIGDARAATANGNFQGAATDLQRAQVARNQNPGIFTPEALRNFDTQIRQTQLELDQARERAADQAKINNDQAAATQLEIERRNQEKQRIRTIQDLRATAMRLTEEARYREALGVVDQILVLDPTNEYAIGVRPLLEDKFNFQQQRLFMQQRDMNFTRQLDAAEEKLIPYDDIMKYPTDWPDISQTRDATVQGERGDNKEDRAVQAQLDRPLPELTFDGVGFNDVIDFLRDVSGANIFVNWKSLEGAGIDRNAPVTAKLRNVKFSKALAIILDSVGGGTAKLSYTIDDGVITIATTEELGKNTVTRVYDIRDLIIDVPDFTDAPDFSLTSQSSGSSGGSGGGGGGGSGQSSLFSGSGQNSSQNQKGPTRQELVDQIIKLVTDTVSPDTWRDAGGSVGSLKELSGNLIVTQTPENQHSLVTLLEQLRESRAIQVTVETRFLIVQRNFLDDVGVDLNFIFNVNGKNSNVFGGPGGPGTAVPVLQQSSLFTALPTTGVPGSIGNLPTAATATGLSTAITYLDDFQVSLLLRATEVSTTSTTVTAPRITLFNGQRAYVLVATQKAYVSNLTAAVGTGASSFTPTVSVVQTGVLLDVAATVSADRKYVTLTLRPELSNLLDISDFTFQSSGSTNSSTVAASPVVVGGITAQAPTGTIQVPEIQLTELKTTVSVPDGGTLLLGGQTLAGETEKEAGVPVLSKIPFLKRLFTNRSMAKDEQILLILVKPTILIEKEIEQKQFPLLTSKLGT